MIKDRKIKGLLKEVASKYNISEKEAEKVIDDSYDLIYQTVKNLNVPEMTIEEIENEKTNFNMPGLFKFFINIAKIKRVKDKINSKEE